MSDRVLRIASTAALAAILGAAGCGSGGGGGSSAAGGGAGSPATGGPGATPRQPPSGIWLAGDLHQHTSISGDAASMGDDPAMSLRLAERAGLDFTCLTDHRTFDIFQAQAQGQLGHPTVIGIPGMEWNGDGHANAIGHQTANSFPVSMGGQASPDDVVRAVVDEVHRQGGIFTVNHPSYPGDLWLYTTDRVDAIEVWNSNWALRATGAVDGAYIAREAQQKGLAAAELARACDAWKPGGLNRQALAYWEELLAQGRKLAAVGGGDRHYLVLPGNPTTRVFAASKTQADILDAVRLGRTVVCRGPDAPYVDFTADADGDGIFETIVGGSVPLGRPVAFRARVIDADGGRVDLVKDGQMIQRWSVTGQDFSVDFTDAASARAWYRLDVYEPLDMSIPHAGTLKSMVLLGGQSWLQQVTSGSGTLGSLLSFAAPLLQHVQRAADAGGAALVWLLFYGDQAGCRMSPVPTRYPVIEFPEAVSRILNVDMIDDDYARGAITSPIYAE
jgi:hypothetical protein